MKYALIAAGQGSRLVSEGVKVQPQLLLFYCTNSPFAWGTRDTTDS